MVRTTMLPNFQTDHSGRIISKCLDFQIINISCSFACMPKLLANPEDKDKSYNELSKILQNIPKTDKVVIVGDFNARSMERTAEKAHLAMPSCLLKKETFFQLFNSLQKKKEVPQHVEGVVSKSC